MSDKVESAEEFVRRIIDMLDDGYEDREPASTSEIAIVVMQRDCEIHTRARAELIGELRGMADAPCARGPAALLLDAADHLEAMAKERG